MYVEAASLTLAARLLQKYCDSGACAPTKSTAHSLDHIRLRRVLAYIAANIKDDITLADLAGIAAYSPFHFARKFTLAMGIPPHRYINHMRLEKAMAELATGKLPLAEIALNAQFSSQASFKRAFHRATGMTPKEFQRRRLKRGGRTDGISHSRDYYNMRRVHRSLDGTTPTRRACASSSPTARAVLRQYVWEEPCHGLFHTPIPA